jgi:hypothetical protein
MVERVRWESNSYFIFQGSKAILGKLNTSEYLHVLQLPLEVPPKSDLITLSVHITAHSLIQKTHIVLISYNMIITHSSLIVAAVT